MPSRARLEWNGDEVLARVTRAAAAAIDDVTEAADKDASLSHPWKNRTGRLEANLVTEPARIEGDRVVGGFGTTRRQGFYGLFLETLFEMRFAFLRPAADRNFPTLAARIREKLR